MNCDSEAATILEKKKGTQAKDNEQGVIRAELKETFSASSANN